MPREYRSTNGAGALGEPPASGHAYPMEVVFTRHAQSPSSTCFQESCISPLVSGQNCILSHRFHFLMVRLCLLVEWRPSLCTWLIGQSRQPGGDAFERRGGDVCAPVGMRGMCSCRRGRRRWRWDTPCARSRAPNQKRECILYGVYISRLARSACVPVSSPRG